MAKFPLGTKWRGFIRWLQILKRKFNVLLKRKNETPVPKEHTEGDTSLEKWKPYIKDYKYAYWNERLKRPVSLAIQPGTYEEYLWNHPEEVRRILLEHGVDPDDESTLGVINIDKNGYMKQEGIFAS